MEAHEITTLLQRDEQTGCWLWQGRRTRDGYGIVYVDGRQRLVHRVVWEQFHGPIPDRLVLDHLKDDRGPCRHRHCANPDHLEPVTIAVNTQRVIPWNRTKLTCPQGHDYATHGHTYTGKDGYTRRYCTACDLARRERRKTRHAA